VVHGVEGFVDGVEGDFDTLGPAPFFLVAAVFEGGVLGLDARRVLQEDAQDIRGGLCAVDGPPRKPSPTSRGI
jgi:hypothetical protein